jgi:DNA-binding MarR family transcriptional regulator
MKLTGRQKAFLSRFIDLYNQAQESLHYTHVAEVLGMGKITAYDMLRSLKERGLVRAEYVLRGKGQGAGRSTVLFFPTSQAHDLFAELTGEEWDPAEWEAVKVRILNALRQRNDYQNLLEDILARLPEQKNPLVYAAEMATAVILDLLLVEKDTSATDLAERLKALGLPGEVGLNALGGLAVGLSLVERANRRLADKLVEATRFYQQSLARLGREGKGHLSNFVQEVMRTVTS